MRILALDPGTELTGWCLIDDNGIPEAFGRSHNENALHNLPFCFGYEADELVIETVASYGMPVGEEVFRTVWWCGRFAERWSKTRGMLPTEIRRKEIAQHLCQSNRASDANIRAALIDLYGGEGGKEKAIGRKATPGPLYGFSKDAWAALAVAVTAQSRFRMARAA